MANKMLHICSEIKLSKSLKLYDTKSRGYRESDTNRNVVGM